MSLSPIDPLPVSPEFPSAEDYVDSLLDFVTNSELFQTFAGKVHILDFFTRSPDLYETIVPPEWRQWFDGFQEEWDIVEWFMRGELESQPKVQDMDSVSEKTQPPESMVHYVRQVRRLSLVREHKRDNVTLVEEPSRQKRSKDIPSLQARTAGMTPKKQHEVVNFASYVSDLVSRISQRKSNITHLIDFGSGANYLGRMLASKPYQRNIVAIENRSHVVEAARKLDVVAKMSSKEFVPRNKKFIRGITVSNNPKEMDMGKINLDKDSLEASKIRFQQSITESNGNIQYVEHKIQDGDLSNVISQIQHQKKPMTDDSSDSTDTGNFQYAMVISLHSCGTLVNHGLRTLTLNPNVKAVALVGCCYNLISERLPTKPDQADQPDQHGFPMSSRFFNHSPAYPKAESCDLNCDCSGLRLNITSRMMAVQAPRNWTPADSEQFFKRHFFRALLQRIFLDYGIVRPPEFQANEGRSPAGTGGTDPIIVGALSKACYKDFVTYFRGAISKILKSSKQFSNPQEEIGDSDETIGKEKTPSWVTAPKLAQKIQSQLSTISDSEISAFEAKYRHRKKHLSIIWTLMAFSAELVEALILVDRWLWLKEQDCVDEAWVESVWDYHKSPRNLVIVGVKK